MDNSRNLGFSNPPFCNSDVSSIKPSRFFREFSFFYENAATFFFFLLETARTRGKKYDALALSHAFVRETAPDREKGPKKTVSFSRPRSNPTTKEQEPTLLFDRTLVKTLNDNIGVTACSRRYPTSDTRNIVEA